LVVVKRVVSTKGYFALASFIARVNEILPLINQFAFCHTLFPGYVKPKYGQVKLFS
jgi:hypothetical protein